MSFISALPRPDCVIAGVEIAEPDKLHCFIDRQLAPGYIGWVMAGVGAVQVGLARRLSGAGSNPNAAVAAFLRKISPLFDFRQKKPTSIRAGLIPCGGLVRPLATPRALLVGDAAFNMLLGTRPMRMAASVVYFHHKGVFDPALRNGGNGSAGMDRRE